MKIFESENKFKKLGFEKNPFSFVLEPQFIKDYIFQREANRAFNGINQSSVLVLKFPQTSTLSDFADFVSFFLRSLLYSPDNSYFLFEVPGIALLNRRLLGAITAIRNQMDEEATQRIYQGYFATKIIELYNSGSLKESLPGFDADELYQKTLETKGRNLIEMMNYVPEEIKKGEEESEESYLDRVKEAEEKLQKRDNLREFFYRIIESEGFGPAVVNSLRAVIQRGLEEGPANLIPVNAKMDLIGVMKFLNYSYSNIVLSLFNLGQIPFLDEEELVEYESLISEVETIVKKYGKVVYLCQAQDLQIVPDVFEGKKMLELNFSTEFLGVDGEAEELQSEEQLENLVYYFLGASNQVSNELLDVARRAAREAYRIAEGDLRYAFKLLESGFEKAADAGDLSLFEKLV